MKGVSILTNKKGRCEINMCSSVFNEVELVKDNILCGNYDEIKPKLKKVNRTPLFLSGIIAGLDEKKIASLIKQVKDEVAVGTWVKIMYDAILQSNKNLSKTIIQSLIKYYEGVGVGTILQSTGPPNRLEADAVKTFVSTFKPFLNKNSKNKFCKIIIENGTVKAIKQKSKCLFDNGQGIKSTPFSRLENVKALAVDKEGIKEARKAWALLDHTPKITVKKLGKIIIKLSHGKADDKNRACDLINSYIAPDLNRIEGQDKAVHKLFSSKLRRRLAQNSPTIIQTMFRCYRKLNTKYSISASNYIDSRHPALSELKLDKQIDDEGRVLLKNTINYNDGIDGDTLLLKDVINAYARDINTEAIFDLTISASHKRPPKSEIIRILLNQEYTPLLNHISFKEKSEGWVLTKYGEKVINQAARNDVITPVRTLIKNIKKFNEDSTLTILTCILVYDAPALSNAALDSFNISDVIKYGTITKIANHANMQPSVFKNAINRLSITNEELKSIGNKLYATLPFNQKNTIGPALSMLHYDLGLNAGEYGHDLYEQACKNNNQAILLWFDEHLNDTALAALTV